MKETPYGGLDCATAEVSLLTTVVRIMGNFYLSRCRIRIISANTENCSNIAAILAGLYPGDTPPDILTSLTSFP